MNNSAHVSLAALRLRREALLRQCALQRLSLSTEVAVLLAPLQSGLPGMLAGRLKLPLLAGGGALSLLLARRKRIMPLLVTAASMWKTTRSAVPLLRRLLPNRWLH